MGANGTSDAALRALATLRAVRAPRCWSRQRRLYGTRSGGWGPRRFEHLWPFANAWSAVASLARVTDPPEVADEARGALADFLAGVARYRRAPGDAAAGGGPGFESSVVPPLGPGGDRYFDDNAWLGLAMVRHHDVLGDERARAGAHAAFAFVAVGWSLDQSARHPGGVRWKDTPDSQARHTCSTGPGMELALSLLARDGGAQLLAWAVRAYDWERAALLRGDDLYADRIAADGTVEPTPWTYNQGAMIGAGVLLHRATGDRSYLEHASRTAAAARRRYRLEELLRQSAAFNAIYFRNLALLDQELRTRSGGGTGADGATTVGWWAEDAAAYAADRWDRTRDGRTGLFAGQSSPLDATVPMIEILALLAGAPGGP